MKRILAILLLLSLLAVAMPCEARPNIKIVYKNPKPQSTCDQKPILTQDQVINIAERSGLSKPKGGWWEVTFSRSFAWGKTPFPDRCVWVVRAIAPPEPDADYGGYGLDITFIQDSSGAFKHRR